MRHGPQLSDHQCTCQPDDVLFVREPVSAATKVPVMPAANRASEEFCDCVGRCEAMMRA